ncbi:glycosyltransferase [Pseudodesulfovibrio piezophilus]|uniref:Glycosyl transferase family 2 n=1 Tax=Pseudodesulfovibrio piezophilus (strain DSM 21447 / JCM 15486 / C1TLV30) TaxID=1322246 RepID=M1WLP4_PSEP2|nr:glycosyltransferase [Pseudodesulfovibrio piezophilus]CCH48215.1 Glycosyl transferase family 2 [Pseudodesulfovibrio piezophilus C1TLV30]
MHTVTSLIQQLITLTRNTGYLTPDHAMAVAGNILEARPLPDALAALAPALLRHATIFDPFDREKIRLAHEINERIPHPPFSQWIRHARALTKDEPIPENIPFPDVSTASAQECIAFIAHQTANSHRYPILLHLWQTGAGPELIKAIRILAASPSGMLAAPLMAWGAYAAGKPLLTEMLLEEGVDSFVAHNLRARIALDSGIHAKAVEYLRTSLEAEPFQPAIIEQLATLESDNSESFPEDNTHICLYTWNKPELLAQTLHSLAHTAIGSTGVTVLNNGTTTCSPDELERRVHDQTPGLSIHWVHLPVNIGAPAARNWLLSLPEVRQCRYVAFLDDDVLLPRTWLAQFHKTLRRFPEAAAVGPKCMNPNVHTIQYAFRHFTQTGQDMIRFSPNAPTLMDMGQFDSARPSLTVMGCCHLLDTKRLAARKVPHFDIRFSPSQVDDIEHDLQIWKAGGQVFYDGSVGVVHLQDTGKAQSRATIGHTYANHSKLEAIFSQEELSMMDAAYKDADKSAFSKSLQAVLPTLNGTARVFWETIKTNI